ncbi:MAG TPA: peptide deformylase [Bacteroidales bacterium]|nr:peptide deformylase [Bacteroidales bacterium]HQQ12521.1 peptide deformylase [Bacteroidales bacterium]
MILPIVAYGHPTLKKVAVDIEAGYPNLAKLIEDMWETMYHANGVGLAAPQVNQSIRLFLVDATSYADEFEEAKDFKKVFINAHITEMSGEEVVMNEGCLSIPGMSEEVARRNTIFIQYVDENFERKSETYSGFIARVIQHEYDHIDGVLYVDRLTPFRKMLLKGKLRDISEGKVDVDYRMIFPALRRKGR